MTTSVPWEELQTSIEARLTGHGDYPRWSAALESLPDLLPRSVTLGVTPTAVGPATEAQLTQLRAGLMGLRPWRKGPFNLFGVTIESEWRSDWKWRRIASALGSLQGQRILDVGCGNGYFGWRAIEAGASDVVGVDPSVLFYLQHQAVSRYLGHHSHGRLTARHTLLPLPFEVLPQHTFDTVLSMGVIYHRRDPAAHVQRLFEFTRPGGRLLLESLIVDAADGLRPLDGEDRPGRYARMRNLSLIPSIDLLSQWLSEAGFEQIEVVDVSVTTNAEQHQTDWMTFESLAQALDPTEPSRTVEGYPAPVRAAVLGTRRGVRSVAAAPTPSPESR